MSKVALSIGERVQLIPFKHKGKKGIIKFIGEIEGKNAGNWVGIELEEPNGDCDGDHEGVQIFECQPKHGIFLRPSQVKSLDADKNSSSNFDVPKDLNQSAIAKVQTGGSIISDATALGLGANGQQDIKQIDGNFDLGAPTVVTTDPKPAEPKPQPEKQAAAGPGRVKGWKERLAKMREMKEKAEEEKATNKSNILSASLTQSNEVDESLDKIKDIFAPAKGLEKDKHGKIAVNKEEVEKKEEPVFEKKSENLVADELKRSVASSKTGSSTSATTSNEEKKTASPSKTNRLAAKEPSSATKRPGAKEETKTIGGGLRGPSRLAKPSNVKPGTEADKKKEALLEKQKALLAKKTEQGVGGPARPGSRMAASGATSSRGDLSARGTTSRAAGRLQTAAAKAAEQVKQDRKSMGQVTSAASRMTGRASARPQAGSSPKRAVPGTSATNPAAGTSRVRGNSATKRDSDLKFGGREGSQNRTQTRFGAGTKERSKSREATQNFAFNKKEEGVKLDPNQMIVNKKEYQDLKDELEKEKNAIYGLNINMTKLNKEMEVQKTYHQQEIEKITEELNAKSKEAYEELVLKHNEERNRLIQESHKSNDSKFNDLKTQFDQVVKEKEELETKLKQTIEDMTSQHAEEVELLTNDSMVKFDEMQKDLQAKIEELTKQLEDSKENTVKLVEKIQKNKEKIDQLEEEIQGNKIDLESNQLEIDGLKDEKAELLAEMTENSKIVEDDILNSLSNDELKQQNRKLRQAVTSLATNFENEKAKLMKQIEDEEGKKKIIEAYEKKLQDMDVLLEELDRKESEIAEVKLENEACLEYETMVEEMAQEILKKEDECEELEKKVKSQDDVLAIHEGYTEELEQYNQELTEENAKLEAKISSMETQKVEDEEILLEFQDENQKYRDKVQQLIKTIKEFTEQIQQQNEGSNEKSKMSLLVEKQNAMLATIRNNEIREIDSQLSKIQYHWDTLLKQKVIEAIIPPRLQENVHFDSLSKLNLLNQSMFRAMLMVRYICEKQMPNVQNMYTADDDEEMERKIQFVKMMITLAEMAVMFINSAQRIMLCVNNMSVEQYIKATNTLMAWTKLEDVSTEMGHIIDRLKDENISLKFDTSVLEGYIKHVSELHIKIEKLYVDKSPEELAQEKPSEKDDEKSKYQMTPAQLDRQKFIQQAYKLDVRHQSMKMCIATIALKVLIGDILGVTGSNNSEFGKKAQLVYGRLLDIVFKIDHIDAEDTGNEFINMKDLVLDKRLNEKYEVITMIWSDHSDPEQIQSKDWGSLLDAIGKDITQLTNDYKFKRLIKQIENTYKVDDGQNVLNIDDIFFIDRFKNDSAPWMEISKRIRTDMQNSEALKDTIQQLKQKNKDQLSKEMAQEKQLNTMKVRTQVLEKSLTQAQSKIEELNSVKGENEELSKKHKQLKEQLTKSIEQIDGHKKHQKEMQKKYEELQKQAEAGTAALNNQANYQENLGAFRKARGHQEPSSNSRFSTFFQELARTSWLSGRKMDSSMTPANMSSQGSSMMNASSAEMQKLLYMQEENYQNIIYQLQLDRMKLKGRKITERLNNMKKQEGGLSEYIKRHAEQKDINIKISREDQNQLVKAIENVDDLRTKVKLQMAQVKVVDLQKKKEDQIQAQLEEKEARTSAFKRAKRQSLLAKADLNLDKPDCVRANMNINYMIIQAREQVNESIQNLMTKDQKLSNLRIDKIQKETEDLSYASTDDYSDEYGSPGSPYGVIQIPKKYQNKVTVGHIQIKSSDKGATSETATKDKVRSKDIVFNVKSLKALQNNIGVFSV